MRNKSIDVIKGLAALNVIFIHVKWGGVLGEAIAHFGSWAVPFFFMVSGYFAANVTKDKITKSVKHILRLIIVAYTINFIRIFIEHSCSFKNTLSYFIENILQLKHLAMWVFLNTTYVSGVAWFLFSLLYCYLVLYFFYSPFRKKSIIITVMMAGFLLGAMSEIVLPLLGKHGVSINNAWMCGIPYFLLGVVFYREKENMIRLNSKLALFFLSIGLGLKILSALGFTKLSYDYIGNIVFVGMLFIIGIQYPNINNKILQKMGFEGAFFIYIMHPIFMHLFDAVYLGESYMVTGIVRPVIVATITIVSAFTFDNLKRKIII